MPETLLSSDFIYFHNKIVRIDIFMLGNGMLKGRMIT